jgi:parallel beta-helix repeat protein
MTKRAVVVIALTLMVLGGLTFGLNVRLATASETIYIRGDGSVDPPTSQISTSDNVTYILTGNINGSIEVERSNIVLDGKGHAVQGTGAVDSTGISLSIVCENVTIRNVEITAFEYGVKVYISAYHSLEGNRIEDNKKYGIWIELGDHNHITGNNITSNGCGICLYQSSENTVSDNNITHNNGCGIQLWAFAAGHCANNTIRNNTILDNAVGIYVYWCPDRNDFKDNMLIGNSYGVEIEGLYLEDYIQNIDDSNTVDGRPIYYWVNQHDRQVPSDAGYVGLVNSTNIIVKDLSMTNNGEGVLLAYTNGSTIENLNCSHNKIGIHLHYSNNNTISRNNVFLNSAYGLWLESSAGNTARSNNMTNNDCNLVYDTWILEGDFQRNDIDASNTLDGKPICCLTGQHDLMIDSSNYPQGIGLLELIDCSDIIVRNLTLTHNWNSILFWNTNSSTIENVTLSNNKYSGIAMYETHNCTVTNTVNDGLCLELSYGNRILKNTFSGSNYLGGYIYLEESDNNNVTGNVITDYAQEDGLTVYSSRGNTIAGNKIAHKSIGIDLENSNKTDIRNNQILNCYAGIELSNLNETIICGNTINALICIEVSGVNNTFYHNNLKGSMSIENFTGNVWDDGYLSGGNYWSDYAGVDANHDGIGDTPYVIDTNNTDHYPLMTPWYPNAGDINFDGKVSLADLVLLANAYGSKPGDVKWNPNADIDGNNIVGLSDLVILANHYGQHYS